MREATSEINDRASKLTGQLLAFARQQTLKPDPFDVGGQVQRVIELPFFLRPGLQSRRNFAIRPATPEPTLAGSIPRSLIWP